MTAAVTFTVTKTADTNDGVCDGDCSLREAIGAANALAGADTITLPAGTYTLSIAGTGENANATGDLDISDDLTINGAGAATTIIDGGALDRVFHVSGGNAVEIAGVTVRNGDSAGQGGGIVNFGTLTLNSSTVSGNTASNGGGILNGSNGTLTLNSSTVSDNTASSWGGGIYTVPGGTLTLNSSTVSGNTIGTDGGGIYNWNSTVTLNNSTVSSNEAGRYGGGIYNYSGTVTLNSSTVSGNNAATDGGGIYRRVDTVELKNTIVANSPSGGDCVGTITSAGYNLDSDGTCGLSGTGDISSGTADLGSLALNAPGTTATHALLSGSDAIDAGNPATPGSGGNACEATDQRGVARPQGTACDIGAYEFGPVNTTDDELNADGDCSLREAIQAANTDAVVDACPAGSGADTIDLPAGTYTLSIAGASEDANATGDLDITDDLTINGAAASTTIVDGGALDRVFHIVGATVEIAGLTVRNGSTTGSGGGIFNNGTLTADNSTISGSTGSNGGGIWSNNTLTFNSVTVSGNTATSGSGGGILNNGTMTLNNSTVSGNTANTNGGGIHNNFLDTLTDNNSTVSGNSAPTGGGIFNNSGTVTLKNTIVANSTSGGDCSGPGTITSAGYNLDSDGTCGLSGTGDLSSGNANLGPLALNAPGTTATHALLSGSDAIDAGNPVTPGSGGNTCEATDQRGVARPQGTACDIGAYEAVDSDSDGVPDVDDNCPDTANPGQEDVVHPGNGGDHCDDPDGDLTPDVSDVCPDDSDNDGDGDGVCNGSGFQPPKTGGNDNCPSTANPLQENADGDQWGDECEIPECVSVATLWVTPSGDEDCDGWSSTDETVIGTITNDACPATGAVSHGPGYENDEDPDAWPADMNDDQVVNLADILFLAPPVFFSVGPNPPYQLRYDLNLDNVINLSDILYLAPPVFFATCTP